MNANVVTDFGYGNSYFMGSLNSDGSSSYFFSSDKTVNASLWYTNHSSAWQSGNINGQVFIPKVALPAGISLPLGVSNPTQSLSLSRVLSFISNGLSQSLFNFMSTAYTTPSNDLYWLTSQSPGLPPANQTPRVNSSMVSQVTTQGGLPPLVERKSVQIYAPSVLDILSSANRALLLDQNIDLIGFYPVLPTQPFSGLSAIKLNGSSLNSYVMNTGPVNCFGDVIINGPLFLKDAQIQTDKYGCRMYATGSVYIEGPITYPRDDGSNNLQIASSIGISMGVGSVSFVYSDDVAGSPDSPLHHRLLVDSRNAMVRSGTWSLLANTMWNDSRTIIAGRGGVPLYDSADPASPYYSSATTNIYYTPVKLTPMNYKKLLLNAPYVQSRYVGSFQGVVISELALFSLGELKFTYDPIFVTAPVLPLIEKNILLVQ